MRDITFGNTDEYIAWVDNILCNIECASESMSFFLARYRLWYLNFNTITEPPETSHIIYCKHGVTISEHR